VPYNPNYRTLRPPPTYGQPTQSSAQAFKTKQAAEQQALSAMAQKPIFTFGSEMQANQAPVTGSFPTVSATVSQWDSKAAGNATVYLGAYLIVVATGPATQKLTVHYCFQGLAISPSSTQYSNSTGSA
jgi:hypothetical protein